jgi:hypothetical protein
LRLKFFRSKVKLCARCSIAFVMRIAPRLCQSLRVNKHEWVALQ